ncbi:MAG TPA: T9SS type A sorting domain-containing protein, partial [Bacteroidia bacterium]|nr:T9SS type A sorting domain-containing protein [Bacteroidia bacterium]
GEIEDYKLIISNDDSLPPIADVIPRIGQGSYTGGAHEFCPGNVQFYDASFHHPSQWHWEFPGGQPAVSDEQNPVVFYDSAGYKTVKLIVTNVFGTDSVTLTNLIYINANAIHFRDVNGAVLGDTVITCNGSTSFYINAADNPYFQTYTWTPAGSDTSLTFNSGPLPTGNYIHLTVETRTVPSCFVKDSLYLILNSPPQIDLSITPGVSEVCAAVSFIDTLTCTNTSSILGTYQYAVHFNSGGPTTLINYGQVPTTLVDTIDLSANSGSTLTYLAYFNPGNTGNSGCSIVSDSVTYTIRSQPSATLRTLDSGLYCIGGRIKAIATRTGGAGNPAYQWISNAGTTVSQNIDTLILDDNSVSPGTISLQYSYSTSNPGCTAYTANYSETLNSRPQVSISTSVDSICNQANLAILCDPDDQTGNGNTGGTYAWSWSSDQGNVWNVLGSGLDTFFVGTLYVPGLSGTDTTVQVRVQYTGSPIELGCNSNPASRNVVIQSTPDVLNSFLNDDLCSGSTPGNPVNLVATIPGSTFQWYFSSGALVQVVPDSGNTIQINPVFTNSSLLQDTTLLYVTATGPGSAACPGITRTIAKFTVNPVPSAPVLPVADSAVCSLSRNIFLSLVAQPGIVCIWDTIPTALHSLKSMDPGNFAVFDFNSVTSVTRDSVSVHALFPFAADCPSPEVYAHFTISPSSAPSQEIAIRKQDLGNTLVCLRNDADSYQWGYDSLPDYQPHFADGQVYQSCSFGNNFDDTKFYYWVIVRQGECESKYYYGGENGQNLPYYVKAYQGMQVNSQPPELSVYPNPGSGSVTLSLKNFTGSTAHFEIYDALGKIVQQSEVRLNPPDDYQSGTDVQQFPPGIYWLRVRSSQEETVLVSFIIQ